MDLYQELLLEIDILTRNYFSFREMMIKKILRPSCLTYASVQLRIANLIDMVDDSTKELESFCEYFRFLEVTGIYFSLEDLSLELKYYIMNYILEQNYFFDLLTYIKALSFSEEEDFITEEFLEHNEEDSKFCLEKRKENQKYIQLIKEERSDIFE